MQAHDAHVAPGSDGQVRAEEGVEAGFQVCDGGEGVDERDDVPDAVVVDFGDGCANGSCGGAEFGRVGEGWDWKASRGVEVHVADIRLREGGIEPVAAVDCEA